MTSSSHRQPGSVAKSQGIALPGSFTQESASNAFNRESIQRYHDSTSQSTDVTPEKKPYDQPKPALKPRHAQGKPDIRAQKEAYLKALQAQRYQQALNASPAPACGRVRTPQR